MNQAEFKSKHVAVATCRKMHESIATIGFGFTSDWLIKWHKMF